MSIPESDDAVQQRINAAKDHLRSMPDGGVPNIYRSPADIGVREGRRALQEDTLPELMASIRQSGLLNPITIDPQGWLIAGLHRLEALKRLGYKRIACRVVLTGGIAEVGRMAEISENLHRAELTQAERDKLIAEYVTLIGGDKPRHGVGVSDNEGEPVPAAKKPGGRGHKGAAAKVAEALGTSTRTVQRAIERAANPDKPKPEKSAPLVSDEDPTIGEAEPKPVSAVTVDTIKADILKLSAEDRDALALWIMDLPAEPAPPSLTPRQDVPFPKVEVAPPTGNQAKGWVGKKPAEWHVNCNAKGGICQYSTCKDVGCCQVSIRATEGEALVAAVRPNSLAGPYSQASTE
jgi:ParB-like chromosome segregation protein Spo0J